MSVTLVSSVFPQLLLPVLSCVPDTRSEIHGADERTATAGTRIYCDDTDYADKPSRM